MRKITSLIILIILSIHLLDAQIRLPKVITDNMVLQQEKVVEIWGEAAAGVKVTILFDGQKTTTTSDEIGRWKVCLDPMKANKDPQSLTIKAGKDSKVIANVLVGEVWLASGQSNMEYSMNNHPKHPKPKKGDKEYLHKSYMSADSPIIRVMHIKKQLTDTLPSEGWKTLCPESLAPISAAGYFFAEHISKELDVPVGIISSAWGGTPIEHWIPEEALEDSPIFEEQLEFNKLNGIEVAVRYDKMIAPLAPFAMRGILWYQGEQNLIQGDIDIYTEKQKLLIQSWRDKWNDQSLSFYYVQLAPHTYSTRRNDAIAKTWEALPMFWQAQEACLEVPGTGMAVITDLIDKASDIHPPYKWEVGRRLALIALAKNYGKAVAYSGPTFRSVTFEEGKAIIEFDNVGEGLQTNDGNTPDWFWLSDHSGRFFKGEAEIIGPDKISVSCKRYKKPSSVRFAWDEVASPNLFNSAGLPVVPFGAKTE